jgi:hypothetical protein
MNLGILLVPVRAWRNWQTRKTQDSPPPVNQSCAPICKITQGLAGCIFTQRRICASLGTLVRRLVTDKLEPFIDR